PAGRKEIERGTRTYSAETRERRDGAEISRHLFTILLQPVHEPPQPTRLIVVPDGILNLLPFDALRGEDGQFLIRSREITYAPSGTILITLRRADKQQPTPRLALAVGDVVSENQSDSSRRLRKPATLSASGKRSTA